MRLSIEVEISKVRKSKALVFAQFRSKTTKTSSFLWKTVKILKEQYFRQILMGNEGSIVKKPEGGMGEMWKLVCNQISWCSKKPQNTFFLTGPLHCENGFWNMKIFALIFSCLQIFEGVFLWVYIQLVPKKFHNRPATYLNCNLFYWKSSICSWPYSTSPQI